MDIPEEIDGYHESIPEERRPHLGASVAGHKCDRYIWLKFRWAVDEKFPGRMKRLFRRGHREEETIISDLRAIGLDISGTQDRVNLGPHFSGSIDGIINHSLLLEMKTYNEKQFNKMLKEGIPKRHRVQMNLYMYDKGFDKALYIAVCKNDDRMHVEWVELDKMEAQLEIDRCQNIIFSDRVPERLSNDPTWFECKFCAMHSFCHKKEYKELSTCRTCEFSSPEVDGTWFCSKHNKTIEDQNGCDDHVTMKGIADELT